MLESSTVPVPITPPNPIASVVDGSVTEPWSNVPPPTRSTPMLLNVFAGCVAVTATREAVPARLMPVFP